MIIKRKSISLEINGAIDIQANDEIPCEIESADITEEETAMTNIDEPIKDISSNAEIKKPEPYHILSKVKLIISNTISHEVLSVIVVAIANGADNIGVYIPLFTGYSTIQLIVTIIIFVFMMAIWCLLGSTVTNFPKITSMLQKNKHIVVPIIFIGLGIYIFIKSGLFG